MGVPGSEVHQDVTLGEYSCEFLQHACHRRDDDADLCLTWGAHSLEMFKDFQVFRKSLSVLV